MVPSLLCRALGAGRSRKWGNVMIRTAGLVRAVFLAGVVAGCGAMEPAPGLQAAAPVAPQVTPVATRVQPVATRPPPTATPLPMPIAGKVVVAVVQVDSLRTRAYPGTEYAILFANRRGDVLYVAGDAGGAENAWLPIYVVGKGYGWVAQRYVELQERPATGVDYAGWDSRPHAASAGCHCCACTRCAESGSTGSGARRRDHFTEL